MNKSMIREVVLAVTYRCNSRCIMCGIWKKSNPEELNLRELKNLPKNLKDINITGGEPFLRDDLSEMVTALTKASPHASIIISTNGFLTEKIVETIKNILPIKPDIGVAVSIDGTAAVHNAIRRIPDAFKKAAGTLRRLKTIGIKRLRISFTLSDNNVTELKKVYALAESMGIELTLTLVHSSENYFGVKNEIRKKEEMVRALDWLIKKELAGWNIKKWLRAYYAFGMKHFIINGKRLLPDYSGQKSIFVDPNGDIYPSDVSDNKMGNLKDIDNINFANNKEAPNWMICTARQAIRKHWFRAGCWIILNKFFTV